MNIYTQASQSCKMFILWKYNATLLSKYNYQLVNFKVIKMRLKYISKPQLKIY